MNLCLPYTPCVVHTLWIGTWKVGCPRVSLHVCPSHLISVATPCLECVHASVHEFMSTWLLMCGPPPMHSLMETGCPCMAVCLCPSHLISVGTPCLECVHASVHEFMSTWLLMSGPPPMLCLTEPGCPFMTVCLCPSHLISVATPCLECVHASVHEFMSTLHPMSGPPPMDSYMESWVPLCITLSVSHSPLLWSHTLFRMCTCISTWIYVYLTLHVWSTPYG